MTKPLSLSQILLSIFFIASFSRFVHGDLGTATHYSPPYSPTACFGSDLSKFPKSNLFAAAGEGIWDNGAACGRQYTVRCFTSSDPKACIHDQEIQITVVDRAVTAVAKPARAGATMMLSTTAFNAIAKASSPLVTVEFREV